jgi:hypothetical protein
MENIIVLKILAVGYCRGPKLKAMSTKAVQRVQTKTDAGAVIEIESGEVL